jgi:hypothetical protein
MTRKQQQLLSHLEERGFDRSYPTGRKGVHVGCNQCEACCINGIACHETGCPNQASECGECGAPIPRTQRLCTSCADDLFPDYQDEVNDDQ